MQQFQVRTSHKPRPLPTGRWAVAQRWNDLLFAHWPLPPATLGALLPEGMAIDTFQGSAWLGVVPFWMDRVKFRGFPVIPWTGRMPDLSLRTYVRDQRTGTPGVYYFSLDAGSLLAVLAARAFYNLPYHWAEMSHEQRSEREFSFYSRRLFAGHAVRFQARFRGLGPTHRTAGGDSGTLEYFLMERYCLFARDRSGHPIRANIHYVPWPLEEAEAEIERNDLVAEIGVRLPDQPPVLHYSRRLAVYIWPAQTLRTVVAPQPVRIAVTPSG
jgi:hypothetical protein